MSVKVSLRKEVNMNNKTKLLFTAAAIVISGATLLSTTQAFAQSTTSGLDPRSSLVQKLADKFGLNKDEVQAVFDQSRQEMQAQRTAEYESRLSQLVKDGKITEAQKQLILAKHKELQSKHLTIMESMKDKNGDERRDAMEAEHEDLEEWAKQNGIDPKYLMFKFGHMKGPGRHGMI